MTNDPIFKEDVHLSNDKLRAKLLDIDKEMNK
jgi:hypothetical protein